MRNFLSIFLIVLFSFGMVVNEASAKRFGGGRSFGVQRSKSSLFSSPAASSSKAWTQRSAKTRNWGGMLGGLLIGGLLASLFMGHGLGTGLLSWLILGSVVFFLVNFFRRKMQPGLQTAQPNQFRQASINNFAEKFYSRGGVNSNQAYPENFVPESFLRDAKVKYIRLQAAYDQKNLSDLQEFTTPEVYAEIKMQLDERGTELNKTEVLSLEAQLLDVSRQTDSVIASVRFTGTIKENNQPQAQLDEIWHFRQFHNNGPWVVGGLQQDVYQPE
ncbi:MAG: Tim44 domain-containing protein [Tatlockia sp.]|nr:Tim44 domain-containing protein [Tatlockia sp.]